jgi:uncharacterized protein
MSIHMPLSIKSALISGASSGIGESLAYLLASKGINLILHGRNKQKLENIAQELQKKVQVEIVIADLAQPSGRQIIIDKIKQSLPDLVINNAGFGLLGEALAYETQQQLEILEVDGKAVLELTLETAKALSSKGKKGIIVNVSSAAGEVAVAPGFAVYAASKALVNHFSQSLDAEFQSLGIRVLASCPGRVKTHFFQRAGQNKPSFEAMMMTSQFAAEQIWQQIQKAKGLYIFDWKTRLLVYLSKCLPKKWVAYVYRKYIHR